MTKTIDSLKIKIRAIKPQDAEQVGMMVKELGGYLHTLGDNTDFQFSAEPFCVTVLVKKALFMD